MTPRLLSPKAAAAYTGLPVRTIRYLAARGRLPYTTLAGGSKRYFERKWLDALVERGH